MASIARQDEFIRSLGVEAYRVGGSVRDEILGREPKDADYIVRGVGLRTLGFKLRAVEGAPPKALVDRQGQQFGWRTQPHGIEISLPRKEANAGGGRKQIITVDPNLSLAEDAKRRDFTFNALYKQIGRIGMALFEPDGSIFDPTGHGLYDLQHRIIRTTHPDSFRDDPLRMLRALRFVSTLDGDVAFETFVQMRAWAPEVSGLTHKGHTSGTVFDEFSKLLMGQRPGKALRLAAQTGVLAAVMPELAAMIGFEQGSRYHDLTTDEHTFVALGTASKVDAPLRVRWALLFHDAGKPDVAWTDEKGYKHYYRAPWFEKWHVEATEPYINPWYGDDHEVRSESLWREAAKRMNVSREFTNDVATLIREHMVSVSLRAPYVKVHRMRVKLGDDLLRDLFMHRVCDLSGKGSGKIAQSQIQVIAGLEMIRRQAQTAKVPRSVRGLEIDGHDVRDLGVKDKNIGLLLREVLDEVVCDPSPMKRSREWQLAAAKRLRVGL